MDVRVGYKESWVRKNWCFWIVVLEKTLESPLDCKEIQPVHPKGNQSWMLIGRMDAEVETPILWPPYVKNWLIWKNPDAGKGWRQEDKGTSEDEMVRWHHWLYGHEFEWALGVGDGWGSLACCSPWGCKELDTTEQLNLTEPQVCFLHMYIVILMHFEGLWSCRFNTHTVTNIPSDVRTSVCYPAFFSWKIYLWLCLVFIVAWGLSPVSVSEGHSLVVVCGLLVVMTSLIVEHRL